MSGIREMWGMRGTRATRGKGLMSMHRHAGILVTGAAGLLGGALVSSLAADGLRVVAADRSRPPDGLPPDVRWHRTELADPHAVAALFATERIGQVVHLAAIRDPLRHRPEVVFSHNTSVTFGVLGAAAAHGVQRAVLASSGSAYGIFWSPQEVSPGYAPLDEDHPLRPADPYGLSKQTDEATAAMMHRAHGLSVVALRMPAVVTGERLRRRVAGVAADPASAKRALWTYLHLDDAVAACRAALTVPGLGCEVIGVAAADTLSKLPTEELLCTYHPATELRRPIPGNAAVWSLDRAGRLLGWRPRHSWRRPAECHPHDDPHDDPHCPHHDTEINSHA
jgi:nucleoside-diphosphate-sugar epimerase